eukprot:Hpha_TRINITY_DN15886_c2_g13::TRINITY_DN15886_c2_g13_i1::g.188092::m.188092/K16582/TTLL6_13; tubulin polyglutamylase TTLL6/13
MASLPRRNSRGGTQPPYPPEGPALAAKVATSQQSPTKAPIMSPPRVANTHQRPVGRVTSPSKSPSPQRPGLYPRAESCGGPFPAGRGGVIVSPSATGSPPLHPLSPPRLGSCPVSPPKLGSSPEAGRRGSVPFPPSPAKSSPVRFASPDSLRRLSREALCVVQHYAQWQGYTTWVIAAEKLGWHVDPKIYLPASEARLCVSVHGKSVTIETLRGFKGRCKRVSHFPLMFLLADKVFLELLLRRLDATLPGLYSPIRPMTFLSGEEAKGYRGCLIMKACRGHQAKGTELLLEPPSNAEKWAGMVGQEYVDSLLVDERKCDLRVYCLVVCADPLWIYIHRQGLVHVCAEKYVPPEQGMRPTQHIANYAVNHSHEEFQRPSPQGDSGCLRSFENLNSLLSNKQRFWGRLEGAIVRAVHAAAPYLSRGQKAAGPSSSFPLLSFELLGVDFAVRSDETPVLLEFNHLPGLRGYSEFDGKVKQQVVNDTFRLIDLPVGSELLNLEREWVSGKRNRKRLEQLLLARDAEVLPETGFHRVSPPSEVVPWWVSNGRKCAGKAELEREHTTLVEACNEAFARDLEATQCPFDPRPLHAGTGARVSTGRWLDVCLRELAIVRMNAR